MRKFALALGTVALIGLGVVPASAQETGHEMSLTGCLAQETEGQEAEYILHAITTEGMAGDTVELTAAEGVDLSAHVGHQVEVTGTMVESHEDEGMMEEGQEAEEQGAGEHEMAELHMQVTNLRHISATCPTGS